MHMQRSACRSAGLAAVAVTTLALGACELFGPGGGQFAEPRYYAHDFFESYEDCAAAQQPDYWFNCSQVAVFCPDGRAELMVTDIVHTGRYTVARRRVSVSFPANPEIRSRVRFALSGDGETLTDEDSGIEFVRKYDTFADEAQQSCAPR